MIRRLFGGLAGVGLVLAACGGDDEPGAKYPSVESFCAAKAAEECKAVAASCTVTDDVCRNARTKACGEAANVATSQGRTYTSANAEACVTRTVEVYKDRVIDKAKEAAVEEACARVFMGSKKRNEACENPYDCENSLVCDLDKKFCAVKVTKKDADPCNNPGDICDEGLYCRGQDGAKFCAPKSKLGEACRVPEQPCAEDVRCNGTSCVALQGSGQPCDVDSDCTTGFCNAERRCQARLYVSETGTCKDFGGS